MKVFLFQTELRLAVVVRGLAVPAFVVELTGESWLASPSERTFKTAFGVMLSHLQRGQIVRGQGDDGDTME